MAQLSSLQNGGVAGIHTIGLGDAPAVGYYTYNVPVKGLDIYLDYQDNGQIIFDTYYPETEGEMILYYTEDPTPFAIPYITVEIDGQLEWVPALIYKQVVNTLTGETFR